MEGEGTKTDDLDPVDNGGDGFLNVFGPKINGDDLFFFFDDMENYKRRAALRKKKKKSILKATQKKGKRCKSKKKKIVSIKLVDMSVSDDGIRNGNRQLGLA